MERCMLLWEWESEKEEPFTWWSSSPFYRQWEASPPRLPRPPCVVLLWLCTWASHECFAVSTDVISLACLNSQQFSGIPWSVTWSARRLECTVQTPPYTTSNPSVTCHIINYPWPGPRLPRSSVTPFPSAGILSPHDPRVVVHIIFPPPRRMTRFGYVSYSDLVEDVPRSLWRGCLLPFGGWDGPRISQRLAVQNAHRGATCRRHDKREASHWGVCPSVWSLVPASFGGYCSRAVSSYQGPKGVGEWFPLIESQLTLVTSAAIVKK